MTVSYINLMRAQAKPGRPKPVVAFACADDLIAAQKVARARLMGIRDADEPKSPPRTRPYRPFPRRDVLDVRTPAAPVDDVDPFESILPQAHWRVICREVCEKYGIPMVDLMSVRRSRDIVIARQEAMYRMRYETNLSYPQIGHRLGGRDHTTVLYGVQKHAERVAKAGGQ